MFIFPADHPQLSLSHQVKSLCNDFLITNKLNSFFFIRCYADGSIAPLSTYPESFIDWHHGNPLDLNFLDDYHYLQTYTYLWDEGFPEESLKRAREKFGLFNGIRIVHRYKHYCDVVSFAMPEYSHCATSYYLSFLKSLNDFYHEFLKKGRYLIQTVEKERIILPPQKQEKNLSSLLLDNQHGRYDFQGTDGIQTYITAQERMCIHLVESGQSYKYIADILEISPRTVDTYIARAKQRTGASHIQDILCLIRKSETTEII